MSSQLIKDNSIVDDDWRQIMPPEAEIEIKKQAGKVVIFKLTGEDSLTSEQIEKTTIPKKGKLLLPVKVFLHHQDNLKSRISNQEIGIWIETHEEIDSFINQIEDMNNVIVLLSVFLFGIWAARMYYQEPEITTETDATVLLQNIKDVCKLVTVEAELQGIYDEKSNRNVTVYLPLPTNFTFSKNK